MFALMVGAQEKTGATKPLSLIGQKDLQLQQLRSEIDQLKASNILLQAQLDQFKRWIFGSRSERFEPAADPQQISLELDVEESPAPPAQKEKITYERNKRKSKPFHPGRTPIPEHLPRIEIVIQPDQDVSGLKQIGTEVTEQLEYKPGKLFVKQFRRPKYALPRGEGVVIAPLPSFPIDKGIPGPGLLAAMAIDKYVDHMPLHRQIARFNREGILFKRATASDWMAGVCDLVAPLAAVAGNEIFKCDYLQADETHIKVQDPHKKGTTHRGFFWLYHDPVNKLVLVDYREGRGRDGPTLMLRDFKGYLQTDGYGAYDCFDTGKIKLLHCMAHARRYFKQAMDNDRPRAEYVLSRMQKLYAVERTAREGAYTPEQRLDMRRHESLPVLEELHRWLKDNVRQVLPRSAIGQAIAYSVSRWEKLMLYASDGILEIDNNLIENCVRPIALGRKNYLFAGSHDAARRTAIIYTLLLTCKLRGVEPFSWLRHVLEVIPDYKANRLHELLPSPLQSSRKL